MRGREVGRALVTIALHLLLLSTRTCGAWNPVLARRPTFAPAVGWWPPPSRVTMLKALKIRVGDRQHQSNRRGLPNSRSYREEKSMTEVVAQLRGGRLSTSRYIRFLPLITATTISAFAVQEILETLHEYHIGHAHGIFSLGLVKLAYAFGELQEQASEVDEVIELEGHEIGAERRVLRRFRSALVGRRVSIVACSFALFACLVEIGRDLRPGGHHGAALLVGSELVNQYHRLRPAEKDDSRRQRRRRLTLMAIAVPAALFAISELIRDLKPGAHHAVAILAAAQFIENAYRSFG